MRLRPLSLVALVTLATCVAACGLEISGQGSPDDPAPGVDDAGSSLVPLSPSPVQPPSAGDEAFWAAPGADAGILSNAHTLNVFKGADLYVYVNVLTPSGSAAPLAGATQVAQTVLTGL